MTEQKSLMKNRTAWIPLMMSLAALLILVGYVAFVGVPEKPAKDEGTAAHIFQLLMVGQLPFMGYFAVRNFRKNAGGSLLIIAIQIFAAVVPFVVLFFFEGKSL